MAIGAPYYDNRKGRVGVYTYDTTSSIWSKKGSDIVGENNEDKCGWGLSITGDGNTIAVGNKDSEPSIIRVFDFDIQTSEWIQRGLIEDLSYTQIIYLFQ